MSFMYIFYKTRDVGTMSGGVKMAPAYSLIFGAMEMWTALMIIAMNSTVLVRTDTIYSLTTYKPKRNNINLLITI